MDKIAKGLRDKERGAAAVEFALVLPILLLVVGGVVEFGRAFWYYDTLSKATRDSARYVSMVSCYAGETVDACNGRLGNVVLKAQDMVVAAATDSGVTNVVENNVVVRCDGSVCTSNQMILASNHVTVAIDNYGITLGSWLPLSYSGGNGSYNLGIQPFTTMRYMGG